MGHTIYIDSTGINVVNSAQLRIANLIIVGSFQAISLFYCTNCRIENVTIHDSQAGIKWQYGANGTIINNTISNCANITSLIDAYDMDMVILGNVFQNITVTQPSSLIHFYNIYSYQTPTSIQNNRASDIKIATAGVTVLYYLNNQIGEMVDNPITNVYAVGNGMDFTVIRLESSDYNITNNQLSNVKLPLDLSSFTWIYYDYILGVYGNSLTNISASTINVIAKGYSAQSIAIIDNTFSLMNNTRNNLGISQMPYQVIVYRNTADFPLYIYPYFYTSTLCPAYIPFSSICYPTASSICCSGCRYTGTCIGEYGTDTYTYGTCSSFNSTCSNLGTTKGHVKLTGPMSYYYNSEYTQVEITLQGIGLDMYYPDFAVFNSGIPLAFTWNDYYYTANVHTNGGDFYANLTISLNGTYDPAQTPMVCAFTTYYFDSTRIRAYTTYDKLYVTWDPYINELPPPRFDITMIDYLHPNVVIFGGSVYNSTFVYDTPKIGTLYRFTITAQFLPGIDPDAQSGFFQTTYRQGPKNIPLALSGPDEIDHLVYDETSKSLYAIGITTASTFAGKANAGQNDIFVAKISEDGTLVPRTLSGTTTDDYAAGAILGSDGNIYIAGSGSVGAFLIVVPPAGDSALWPYFSSVTGDVVPMGLIEVAGVIWVAGYTTGNLDGDPADGFYKSFAFVVDLSDMSLQGSKVWTTNSAFHEQVTGIEANVARGVVYISGTTVDNFSGYQSGFIAQFTDITKYPTVFSFRSSQDVTQPGGAEGMLFYKDTNTIIVLDTPISGLTYIPIDPSTGFIQGYLGCLSMPTFSPPLVNSSMAFVSPAICSDLCFQNSYTYSAVSNGTSCSCSNSLPTSTTLEDISSCTSTCLGFATQRCGGPSAYTVSLSANTQTNYDLVSLLGGYDAQRMFKYPAGENAVGLFWGGDSGPAFDVFDPKHQMLSVGMQFSESLYINAFAVDPTTLRVMLGGDYSNEATQPDLPVPVDSQDSLVMFSFLTKQVQAGGFWYNYTDFSSVTLSWDRPFVVPNSVSVSYTVSEVTFRGEVIKVVYQGPDLSVLLPGSDALDSYYNLTATGNGFNVSASLYVAKFVLINVYNYFGYSPVILFDEVTGQFVAQYNGPYGYSYIVSISSETGEITPLGQSPFGAVEDFHIGEDAFFTLSLQGLEKVQNFNQSTVLLNDSIALPYNIDLGLNDSIFYATINTDLDSGTYYVMLYQMDTHGNTLQTTDWGKMYTVSYPSDTAMVKAYNERKQLFVIASSTGDVHVSYLLHIDNYDTTFDTTRIDLADYFTVMKMYLDKDKNVLYILGFVDNNHRFDAYHIDTKTVTPGVESGNGENVLFGDDGYSRGYATQTHAVGKGFWNFEDVKDVEDNVRGLDVFYNDLLSAANLVFSLPLGPYGSYEFSDLTLSRGATDLNNTIAIGGSSYGTLFREDTITDNDQYFILFTREPPLATTLRFTAATRDQIQLEWAPPIGVLQKYNQSLYYTLDQQEEGGEWGKIYNGSQNNFVADHLTPLTRYYFRLTAFFGESVVQYPILLAKTKANFTYDEARNLTVSSDVAINAFFDPSLTFIHVITLPTQPDEQILYTKVAADNFTFYDTSDLLGQIGDTIQLPVSAAMDKNGKLYVAGGASGVASVCEITSPNPVCQNFYVWSSYFSTYGYIAFTDSNETWVLGATDGFVNDYYSQGFVNAFVAIYPDFAGSDVQYVPIPNIHGIYLAGMQYNSEKNLMYVLTYYNGDSTVVLIVTTFDVATRAVIGPDYEFSTGMNDGDVYTLLFDASNNVLVTLSYGATNDTSFISYLTLNSSGLVIADNTISLDFQITSLSLSQEEIGMVGRISTAFPGFVLSGAPDAYFGLVNDLRTVQQFGTPGYASAALASVVHPTTLTHYVFGVSSASTNELFVHVEPPGIGSVVLSVLEVTHSSILVKWTKPAFVPTATSLTYYFACQNSTHLFNSSQVSTPALNGTFFCAQLPNFAVVNITANVSTGHFAIPLQIPVIFEVQPIKVIYLGNGTVHLVIPYLPAGTNYTIEMSKIVTFDSPIILAPGDQNVTLPDDSAYYFRVHIYSSFYASYFSPLSNISISSVFEPMTPVAEWITYESILVSWTPIFSGDYSLLSSTGAVLHDGLPSQYHDRNLLPASEHSYQVKFVNANGTFFSPFLTVTTHALPTLTLVGLSTTSINVTVTDFIPQVNYTLEYSSNNRDFLFISTLNESVPFVVLTNLQTAYNYQFRVRIDDFGSQLVSSVFNGSSHDCDPNMIRCLNGTCVDSLAKCARPDIQCPRDNPYLCFDLTCARSYRDCNVGVQCDHELCWDGACVLDRSQCLVVPTCPYMSSRCPDGSCAEISTGCGNQNCPTTLCADGSCPPCLHVHGCPLSSPFMCPNGICVANHSWCYFNCSSADEYQCYDGSCVSTYSACVIKPPRIHNPISFFYVLPQRNTSAATTTISVEAIANDLSGLAQIELPTAILPLLGSPQSYVLQVGPVPESDIYGVSGKDVWGDATYSSDLASAVLSLSFPGVDTSNFKNKVKLTFYNTLPQNTNVSIMCIGFINELTNAWECESTMEVVNGTLQGYTTHFTKFAVLLGKIGPPKLNPLTGDSFKHLKDIDKSTIAAYVLAGIVFFYLVGLFFTIRSDKRHKLKEKFRAESSRSIMLTDLNEMNAPPSPTLTPSSSSVTSSPTLTTPMFHGIQRDPSGKWQDTKGKNLGMLRMFAKRFRAKHTWIAVTMSPHGYGLTRTDLLTLLLCMILGNLVISAAFYQNTNDLGVAQKLINGIVVAFIVFPITLILSLIFKKMPSKYFYISYIIAYSFCAVCIIITLVYALQFGDAKAKAWLISITISTGQDAILNQPIKLVITTIVLFLFPTAWFAGMML